jgi:hypothetical protein
MLNLIWYEIGLLYHFWTRVSPLCSVFLLYEGDALLPFWVICNSLGEIAKLLLLFLL